MAFPGPRYRWVCHRQGEGFGSTSRDGKTQHSGKLLERRSNTSQDMTRRKTIWSLVLLVLLSSTGALASTTLPFCRAIYGPWNYSQDAKVGLDADYDNSWWTSGAERNLERFSRNSLDAAEHNVTYIVGLYYLGDRPGFNYTRAVDKYGHIETYTPSNVDPTYWSRLIREPAVAIANLSLYRPIWGIAWDFELYLHENFGREDYSYDEPAIQAFANATNRTIPNLPPSQRYTWLLTNGLDDEFRQWERDEVYRLAKRVEHEAHAINPNLSLGILGFGDSWFYWTILEAFSTPQAPVTAWTEDTYGGYNEERIGQYQKAFAEHSLNGKVLPGLYTVALNPWRMITDMERAIRHNGVFWIYQHDGDQYRLADEWTYSWAYELFNRFFFFNKSRADPLPVFQIYPGIEARPYRGPEGVTLLLSSHNMGPVVFDNLSLVTSASSLLLVGENLSIKTITTTTIPLSDLPAFIYGLSEDDLLPTEVRNTIRQLQILMKYYNMLGMPPLTGVQRTLNLSLQDYQAGRYSEAKGLLDQVGEEAYQKVLEAVWPQVEAGFASPRNSSIPLTSLSRMWTASRMFSQGDASSGQLYLLAGLREWALAVDEFPRLGLSLAAILLTLLLGRGAQHLPRGPWGHRPWEG